MGTSIQPDPNWHKQKTPQEWQAIQDQAVKDHRINIHDEEAMTAIRDSNEALNMYEQPAIEAGKHTLDSGWGNPLEAVKGEAEGGLDALLAPFHIANTVYRQGPGAALDEMVEGIKSVPGEIASGDSRRIGRVGGNVAGGIATAKFMGKVGSGAKGVVSELAERPMLKNALIKSQINSLSQGAAKSSAIMPDVIEQAGLKTDAMRQGIEHKSALHPDAVEQAGLKTNQMHQNVAEKAGTLHDDVEQARLKTESMKQGLTKGEQEISKGAGTLDDLTKRPGLLNQLTELQIKKLQKILDDMDNEEGDGSQPAPFDPLDPKSGPSNNLRDIAKEDFKNEDPYGLNDITDPKGPTDKFSSVTGQQIPPIDDIPPAKGPGDFFAKPSRPLSSDEMLQLLEDLNKKKPKK